MLKQIAIVRRDAMFLSVVKSQVVLVVQDIEHDVLICSDRLNERE